MPRYLSARPPADQGEARQVRQLAHSRHAPADWIVHAKMVVRSWEGQRTREMAQALGRHPQTHRRCATAGRPTTSAGWRGWGSSLARGASHA